MAALASAPLIFFDDVRFHVPVLPLWAVPVAVGLLGVARRVGHADRAERAPVGRLG